MTKQGLEYLCINDKFFVRYNAPSRKVKDIKTEFYIDAKNIYEKYGKVYVGFSSGIDSQIIASCFSKQGIEVAYIFLYMQGYNELEYKNMLESSRYLGIDVEVIQLDIDAKKEEWIHKSKLDKVQQMHQYAFEWLSENLDEDYPFVMQGANEPCIVGSNSKNVSIYVNQYENMRCRIALMEKYRKIIDFPYSSEAISSYYTDDATKGFCTSLQSYRENNLYKNNNSLTIGDYWNYYAKPIVKGKYFSDDIIWYGKISGFENFPSWVQSNHRISNKKVSVPYWNLVEFLENNIDVHIDYSDWTFSNETDGWYDI